MEQEQTTPPSSPKGEEVEAPVAEPEVAPAEPAAPEPTREDIRRWMVW